MAYFREKGRAIVVILYGLPKGQINRKLTKDRFVIECPSYGIYDCTKKLKKRCNLRPMNSDGSSDMCKTHWRHHFKRIHDKGKIYNNTLKIANNHLRPLHRHHLIWHGSSISYIFTLITLSLLKTGPMELQSQI